MSGKEDFKYDYEDSKTSQDYYDSKDENNCEKPDPPKINVLSIDISPHGKCEISSSLDLGITFELDRDVVAGYWNVQFLVDSGYRRIIKVLGQTEVEDYVDGESDMRFKVDGIDISGIPPSSLTNSGLLMAVFMVDGEEVASVNMVVNVTNEDGALMREILSPLD